MTILEILFALASFGLLTWDLWKMTELDDMQERLDKYSVHLDERANKLAQWEQELRSMDK